MTATAINLLDGEVDLFGVDDREARLDRLIAEAHDLLRTALREHIEQYRDRRKRGRKLAAICIMFSGGNDSIVLAHLMRGMATHAVLANTETGIEETYQFVRDTCRSWRLPLIEKRPPVAYRDLVIEHGFPGPAHHEKMYQRLKERCFRAAKRDLMDDPRNQRVVFLAGRRRRESERRNSRAAAGAIVPVERDGNVIWVSPLHDWTNEDINTYRKRFVDCPRNEVADHLHMSGECLCGAFARPDELDEVGFFYPAAKARINQWEAEALAAGKAPTERCRWGWGAYDTQSRLGPRPKTGRLCSSCAFGQLELFDEVAS